MNAWVKPRKWIESLENGDLRIVEETASFLSQITKPVVVIAVAGLIGTGKSYIMNRLAGTNTGFALGPTGQAETKGIWIWCVPYPGKKNHVLVLIDTEGFRNPKQVDKNNISIFCLSVLLSSTFIFNIRGNLDQEMINDLHLITELPERITVKSSQKSNEDVKLTDFSEFLPAFVVAIRDFSTELRLNDRLVSANEYFNNILKLKAGFGRKAFEYNQSREVIRNSFRSHFCLTFTRPVRNEQMFSLLAANQISDVDLSSEFIRQSKELCHHIYSTSTAKTLKLGQPVTGRVLSTLAAEYVKVINSGSMICIESIVTLVAQRENERVIEESIQRYKKTITSLENFIKDDGIDVAHKLAWEDATDYLTARIILDNNFDFLNEFVNGITNTFEQACRESSYVSSEKCSEIINFLYVNIIGEKLNNREYAQLGGYIKYCEDFKRFLDEYKAIPRKGVKADEILYNFMKEKDSERNLIRQADNQLTELQKESERIGNEKKLLEMEIKAGNESHINKECHNDMLRENCKEYMHKIKQKFEGQQREKEVELQNLLLKRIEEKKRLMEEGFEEKAQLLNTETESLKSQKNSSIIEHLFKGVKLAVDLAHPELFMIRKIFEPPKP